MLHLRTHGLKVNTCYILQWFLNLKMLGYAFPKSRTGCFDTGSRLKFKVSRF